MPNIRSACSACSCGESAPHIVARRSTADGTCIEIWHDGAVTGRSGLALPGVPIARPRSERGLALARATSILLSEDVAMYDVDELPQLYACARRVATRGGSPGDLRALFSAVAQPALRLAWETYATDHSGTPTVRVARLDRIRWPGLVVWHERGRYDLLALRCGSASGARSREALVNTGLSFASQHELRDHLFSIARRVA